MIRTRFAPSPTGFMHVGSVRTALFAWLLARQQGGQFVLRIEDTDQSREVEGSVDHIINTLRTLGIDYDEGPDQPGKYGPYHQSERLELYRAWAQKLIDSGRAYADPYTPEELQSFRDQARAEKRAFLYRNHRPENPPEWDGTTPLRFKSDPKAYQWHDEVMGDLSTGPEVIDDIILIKSDGFPTYNFAHIVDDAEMKITHIIRGQEFIASQPNYLNIYEALGLERPVFATVPHILAGQGNKKLGKRDGAKDVLDYLDDGYVVEALVNFIASLGWNDGTEQEVFTREELIAKFSLDRVQRSGARFDEQRLLWLNGQHIRRLSLDDLYARVSSTATSFSEDSAFPAGASRESKQVAASGSEEKDSGSAATSPFWPANATDADEGYKKQVLALAQDRLKTLADLPVLTSYFFEEPTPDIELITSNKQLKKLSNEERISLLQTTHDAFATLNDWTPETIQNSLNNLLETTGQKPGILFSLVRIATTWALFSPQLNDTMALLGRDKTLARLITSIDFLR